MFDDRTNLYRVVAQTLQWIHGRTGIEYEILESRIANVTQGDTSHQSFQVITNTARISKLIHPLALVADEVHLVLTGVLVEYPDYILFRDGVVDIEIDSMPHMFLQSDNGGYSTVGVQTQMGLIMGGVEILSRHFIYRNNLLHKIR